ncbi:MAG: hypothetical protein WA705_23010 [Candidatus Ozemobacteraceae bacterium]
MYAIKREYEDLPETIIVPKELVHKKGEIIIITQDEILSSEKRLRDFSGCLSDFPERFSQGRFEEREKL